MNLKKTMIYTGVLLIAWLLLNIYSSLLLDIRIAASRLDVDQMIMLHIFAMIVCFLFGVLLEWKHLVSLFSKKLTRKISISLILGVILLLTSLLPPMFYIMEFSSFHMPFPKGGVGINMVFGLFNQFSNVQAILSVTAGTLVIKGLLQ